MRCDCALAGDLNSLAELREQSTGDVIDAVLDSAQDEISSQLAEVESRELALIENCARTHASWHLWTLRGDGKPIPLARLQALPYATMCIEAQREVEKRGLEAAKEVDWSRLIDTSGGEQDVLLSDIEMDVS